MIQKVFKLLFVFCLFSFQFAKAQTTVSGKITDGSTGMSLPGVNVVVKGTTKGISSDFEGKYSINVPNRSAILVFSYVGYAEKEVTVSGSTTVNVSMSENANQLGEVVVTALGISKDQRKLGYAVTTVGGDNLDKARETNVANGLAGRVSGLVVRGTSSGAGGTSKVLLRGISGITSGGSPLFVIDGIPIDNTQRGSAGEWGGADQGDGIGNINPDDIEKMTVLKGQSASALYGARAVNGVIIITTKKGKKGGDYSITFNSNFMADAPVDYTDFQSQYGQGTGGSKPLTASAALASNRNSWGGKLDGSSVIGFDGKQYVYGKAKESYIDFYRTGTNLTNTVSVSKGVGNGAFRLSFSNLDSKSIVPNSGLKRTTINLSADQNITDKLNVAASVNYTDERSNNRAFLSDGPKNPNNFLFLAPNVDHNIFAPGYDPVTGAEIVFSDDNYVTNPYFIVNQGVEDPTRKRIISVLSTKYNFTDNIYAMVRLGNDVSNDTEFSVNPWGLDYTTNKRGSLDSKGQSTRSELNLDGLFGAKFKIGSDFSVDALAGANIRQNKYERIKIGGGPFVLPYLYTPNNVVNINREYNYTGSESHSAFYSFDFGYKKYLTLSTTGRYDVYSSLSSAASSNNGVFTPSVSGAFVFNDLLHIDALDFGKVRVSYAVTSGEATPYTNSLYFNSGNSLVSNGVSYSTGSIPSTLPTLLKPFTVDEIELGLDLRFLKSRLTFDLSYYQKTSHDEILNAEYSRSTGFATGVVASASIQNKGLEIAVTGIPVKTDNFTWTTSLNTTNFKNKVLATNADATPIVLGSNRGTLGNAVTAYVVGAAGPQIRAYDYAYNTDGSIQVDAAGLPVRGEFKNFGSVLPTFYGGWNNEFKYKNFNLAFLVDFNYGNKVISATEYYSRLRGLNQATLVGRETGVTNSGITATAENYYQAEARNITSTSVVSGDFIKLRQLSFGYAFPKSVMGKISFLEGIDVSFVARNLAILMRKADNIDPESSFGSNVKYYGIEGTSLPSTRSFGLNVNFKIK
ncbi:SusC/RagA family TonB-linked outer membrane protein [Flavobacterium sp. ZT3R17]|uniref:SusC/RagA family TonB-linked outer membrane protein n=1 Tax=Flavobacterium cryoconiti TaxID=3398736 RepID=UPI003A8AA22A